MGLRPHPHHLRQLTWGRWVAAVGSPVVCEDLMQGHPSVTSHLSLLWAGGLVAGEAGCCLLFEICIVDASIFVAKFFRAHGGCLGIRSR